MSQNAEVEIAHTSSETIGRPRVLIIAAPELAAAVREALDPWPQHEETSDRRGGTHQKSANDVSELCAQILPRPARADGPAAAEPASWLSSIAMRLSSLVRTRRPALTGTQAGAVGDPSASAEMPASLFRWGDYDYVILQDLWVCRAAGAAPALESAGYEFSRLDYYVRGNFNTKKIILVTDDEFLPSKVAREPGEEAESLRSVVRSAFDEKDALGLVSLKSPDALRELRALVGRRAGEDGGAAAVQPDDGKGLGYAAIRSRVREVISGALREYIRERAEVVFIDDEMKDLKNTFREVTGSELTESRAGRGGAQPAEKRVHVADSWSGRAPSETGDFDGLVRLCVEKFDEVLAGGKDYVLFVTDILFKLPLWKQTGVDLIEILRRRLAERDSGGRFGIVAFTGFTTPFIAMSSYHRGADFVVPKLPRGTHDDDTEGTYNLLITLASLCFQKSFLRNKRNEAKRALQKPGEASRDEHARALRQLKAILPQHVVSPHLQQEWQDTCYLLDIVTIYGPGSEHLRRVFQEVNSKYDA